MSYTVSALITDAYYSSSLVAREFEAIQGYQLNDALRWLNQILLDNTVDAGEIPYITTYLEFNCVPGQEKYYLANLIDIQSIVFFIQSVRYEMKNVGRRKYFGTPRANNINALPLSYRYERAFGGVNLFLYFFPNQAYTMQIVGNTYMNTVTLNQDLSQCIANLGAPIFTNTNPSFTLTAGQFVVNGVDLAGTYNPTISPATTALQNFVAYINTGVVTNVTAAISGTQLILTSSFGEGIKLVTNAQPLVGSNTISFENFSTVQGFQTKTYTGLDQFYADFLRYKLADRICKENNFATPPGITEQLNIYRQKIIKMAEPMDLQIQKISCMTRAIGVNWGQANIGKGWSTNG